MGQDPAAEDGRPETGVDHWQATASIPRRVALEPNELVGRHSRQLGVQLQRAELSEHLGDKGHVAGRSIDVEPDLLVQLVVGVGRLGWNHHPCREGPEEARERAVQLRQQRSRLRHQSGPARRSRGADANLRSLRGRTGE